MKRYRIPENFIDESRIFKGMVRTRFFIEGAMMAMVMLIPAFLIPVSDQMSRISLVVTLCGVPLMIGTLGVNGDPISVVVRNFKNWKRMRGVMLYNTETVPLKTSPLTASMSEKRPSDAIIEMVENYRDNRREKMAAEVFVEGVTFQFAKDPDLVPLYADQLSDTDDTLNEEMSRWHEEEKRERDPEKSEPDIEVSIDVDDEEGYF